MPDYEFMRARYARDVSAPIDYTRFSVAETQDLSIVQTQGKAQRWDFRIPLETDVFGRMRLEEAVNSDILSKRSSTSFDLMVPQPVGQLDAPADAAVRVEADRDAGSSSVDIWRTSPTSFRLHTGRYIRFSGDAKVYRVVQGRTLARTDRSYNIRVYPALRRSLKGHVAATSTTPEVITPVLVGTAAAPVMARVVYHPDMVGMETRFRSGNIVRFELRFVEVV